MSSLDHHREEIRAAFTDCRTGTLAQIEGLEQADFKKQAHPQFSPIGWHLGHIAYSEALWLCHRLGDMPIYRSDLIKLFDVSGLKNKADRCNLPPLREVLEYAGSIRAQVFDRLPVADIEQEAPVWNFLLQHEAQHSETIALLRQLLNGCAPALIRPDVRKHPEDSMVPVPGGPAWFGSDAAEALDNERPRHRRFVADFRISRYPVTQAQFQNFMDAGGYRDSSYWSAEGWAWLKTAGIHRPLHWREGGDDHPVCGVSAHEAEAWCRYNGVRLPTEFEWEKAAAWDPETESCRTYPWGEAPPEPAYSNFDRAANGTTTVGSHLIGQSHYGAQDMLGNTWEWTSSDFSPYQGFESFPYEGYSATYFDGKHQILRGGSWATRPWVLRNSVRSWYTPETRQILSGFRYAQDELGS